VRFEPLGGQPAMALAHELRGSAPGLDRLFDRQRIIGPVGINLARSSGIIEGAILTSASLAGVVSTPPMMPLSLSAARWAL
jgi:hypothetical protein